VIHYIHSTDLFIYLFAITDSQFSLLANWIRTALYRISLCSQSTLI